MQWIVDIWFSNNVCHNFHFEDYAASREIAVAFAGSFMAAKALAGVRSTLDTADNGRIVIMVDEPGAPLPFGTISTTPPIDAA